MNRPARSVTLPILSVLFLLPSLLGAQVISGLIEVEGVRPSTMFLFEVLGADHVLLDSARTGRKGDFTFKRGPYPAGFYELGLNDSDRVDIILDPREKEVQLAFSGTPLQNHITVLYSTENQRLWEYKWISRESQARVSALRAERSTTAPEDLAGMHRLDSLEAVVKSDQRLALRRLVQQDTTSYFAQIVNADERLMKAVPLGARAIGDSFRWSDPRLLRSSIYPKAIMSFLEATAMDTTGSLMVACDSLLTWSADDMSCWRYARLTLVKLFSEYGHDLVTQHIVDRYVAGISALLPAEPELQVLIADLLRVSIGSQVPQVSLKDLSGAPPVALMDVVRVHSFTCLFFYSSTCDHCHDQMPGLRQLRTEFKDRGFEVVGIALDTDSSEFRSTIESEQLGWPSYTDLMGWGAPAARAFVVKSTPSLCLIDRSGRIIAKPFDHQELRAHLEELLP